MSVDHYENFPVASVLCPPHIRPAVVAIYHYARTADDLADEGDAAVEHRLADLQLYREDLLAALQGRPTSRRWSSVFRHLARAADTFKLPTQPLLDLLDAFELDVHNPTYNNRAELLDYCRRSANPVGRLLLHLYGVEDAVALQRADAICSALQLINFWQDLSVDSPRQRHYVPQQDLQAHGLTAADLGRGIDSANSRRLVATLCAWAKHLMLQGAPLALQLPGRAGWELRLVVQGGLRILEKIEQMDNAALSHRPKLSPLELPLLLWRALCMPWQMRSLQEATRDGPAA